MLGEALALQQAAWLAAALIAGGAAAGRVLYIRERGKSRAMWMAVLLFFTFLGYGRMEVEKGWVKNCLSLAEAGENVWIEGTAEAVEDWSGQYSQGLHISLSGCSIVQRDGRKTKDGEAGRIEAYLEGIPEEEIQIGSRLRIYGELEVCQGAGNPGEFDFQIYYLGFRSCYRIYGEEIEIVYERKNIKQLFAQMSKNGCQVLDQLLDEKDAGVMKAMLLGDKTGMDETIKGLYQDNGIAHILAISGLHISLIGAGFYRLLRKCGLSFGLSAAAGTLVLFCYGTMTGFSSSSCRAIIMMAILFLAEYRGRTYDMASAAGLAGLLLMMKSPFLILQSGFQLSFGAVLSIGLLGKRLEEAVKPEKGIWRQMTAGAAIQIGTCPIVAYHFFQYPIYGFFLNLAVIPLMTYAVVSGILGMLLGMTTPVLGKAALGTCHYVLLFYEYLCRWTEKLPYSNIILGRPALWQMIVYGCFTAWGIFFIKRRKRLKGLALTLLCICLFAVLHPSLRRLGGPSLTVTFLDVGQGDGILIEKGNITILIDGGSSDEKRLGSQVLEPCLKSKGIRAIDYIIVSHGDEDHISGIKYLLEEDCGIRVKNLVMPYLGKEEEAQKELTKMMETAELRNQRKLFFSNGVIGRRRREGSVWEMKAGDRIEADGMELICLYPSREDEAEGRNQQSLVMAMRFQGLNLLFTGDTEKACEKKMMDRVSVRNILEETNVLKVAHHGSDSASSEEFLSLMEGNLKWAMISCGKDNKYGHPSKEVTKRLKEKGAVILITEGNGAVVLKSGIFLRIEGGKITKNFRISYEKSNKSFDFLQ